MVLGRKRQVLNTVNQKNNYLGTLQKKNEEISEFIAKKFMFRILS